MRSLVFILAFALTTTNGFAQSYHSEIGLEIQAANFSNVGGSFGGALKWAFVEEDALAFGPSFRYQYIFSQDKYLGTSGSSSIFGGGGFLHYRFLDWFFIGSEVEMLKNPYNFIQPDKRWTLTAYLGGGISKDLGFVRLNLGILYDVADALRDPLISNPSPLSNGYFLKIRNPNNPNIGDYVPMIYRVAFFFPLNRNKENKEE
ncbi:hypothetical protein [Brumimicrobium mesophilum]|uniref:hypothetical protein n=1 Tax=Brumimicrobium mesophilum TaxID=392717 RepID=UPI000D142C7D|nr:hypothetical protein [Brumimicrobium mesophilum]